MLAIRFLLQLTRIIKIPLVTTVKSHVIMVANDKRYWMKEKNQQYMSSFFDSILYILSHVTKMLLFWSLMKANDVVANVSTFNYLK